MVNNVVVEGRLAKDVNLSYSTKGNPYGAFNVVTDIPEKGEDGKYKTTCMRVCVNGKIAENCANHIGKGRLVSVVGYIRNRQYGEGQFIVEVVANSVNFLDYPKDEK